MSGENAQQLAAQAGVFLAQRQVFQSAPNLELQFFHQLVGLDDVTVRAEVQGLDGRGHSRDGGDENEGGGLADFFRVFQQFDPG